MYRKGVSALIMNKNKELLLVNLMSFEEKYFAIPGGGLEEVRHSLRSFGFIIFGPDNNVVAYAQCSSNRLWRFRMCRTPEYHRCYTYTFPYKGAWLLENNSNDCLSAIMNGLLER